MEQNNNQFSEQDEYIRKRLQEDKIIDQPLFDKVTKSINESKVKVSTFSYTKQIMLVVILIILILALCLFLASKVLGINLFKRKEPVTTNTVVENKIESENIIQDNTIADNTVVNNTSVENTISNEVNNNTVDNAISNNVTNEISNNSVSNDISNTTQSGNTVSNSTSSQGIITTQTLNMEHLEKFVSDIAIGIERISFDEENLESNTILLYIAKHYFDTTNAKSVDIDTKYASTVDNVHKYLSELTGKDYSGVDYIRSFNNYVGYIRFSNAYMPGKNISDLSREKYKVSNVQIVSEMNHVYTATAKVYRTIGEEETEYKITFDFTINSNYDYQEFCLKSLKAVNYSFFPDNTVHLIEN